EEPPTPEEPTSTPATTKTGTATVDLGAGITESNWSDYEDKIRYQIGVGPSGRAVYDSKNPFTDAGKSFTYSEGDQVRARIQFNIGTAEDPQWVTSASSDTTAGTEDVSVSLADTNAVDKLAALEVVEKLKDETGVDSTCTDAAAVITAQDWEAKKKFLAECIDKRVLAGMEEWAKMARAIVGEANAAAVDQALQDVKDELETVDLSVGLDAYYAARLALYRTLAVEFADKINTSGLLSTEIDTGKLTGETLSGVDKAMSDQFNGKSLAEITEEKQQEAKENAVTDIPKSVNAVVEAQVANDKNVLSEAQRAVINEQLQAIVNDNTLTLEQKLAKADALKKAIGQLGTAIITANAAVVKAENELAGKDALLSRLAVLTAKLNTESSKGDATGQSVDQAREEYQLKVENLKTEATEESSAPTDTEEFRKELETTENGSQSNPNDSNNTVEPSTPRASTSSGSSSWWQILLIVLGLLGIGSAIAYGIQQQQMNR
ncbi:MAG: hypothetical protein Q3972_06695, partial [Corynebacterium sp.]|nr:hypothetical protein [Corynebacterium sp.]